MTTSIEYGQLYGVITKILPNGKLTKCEPIFVKYSKTKNPSVFYRGIKTENGYISHFEVIDVSKYGKKCFLPASHKKIDDDKEYFLVFQPTKNHTKLEFKEQYRDFPIMGIPEKYFSTRILNIGILFPNKFVVVISHREMSEAELLDAIE